MHGIALMHVQGHGLMPHSLAICSMPEVPAVLLASTQHLSTASALQLAGRISMWPPHKQHLKRSAELPKQARTGLGRGAASMGLMGCMGTPIIPNWGPGVRNPCCMGGMPIMPGGPLKPDGLNPGTAGGA